MLGVVAERIRVAGLGVTVTVSALFPVYYREGEKADTAKGLPVALLGKKLNSCCMYVVVG